MAALSLSTTGGPFSNGAGGRRLRIRNGRVDGCPRTTCSGVPSSDPTRSPTVLRTVRGGCGVSQPSGRRRRRRCYSTTGSCSGRCSGWGSGRGAVAAAATAAGSFGPRWPVRRPTPTLPLPARPSPPRRPQLPARRPLLRTTTTATGPPTVRRRRSRRSRRPALRRHPVRPPTFRNRCKSNSIDRNY